ncbi:MAG: Stealth CR1 domain-containing protein [Dysgonamonadaceae bacterium]|jgi:hypothetical protein|nr:Stealth CR1 domain-containing protein [Dysgonamonadaceae bacterium]
MDIDLVYLWVDGNDPVWRARKDEFLGIEKTWDETICRGRYANNNELRYSLRSVEKHLPWIRKIFIITDRQTPAWLNTSHPNVQIVDHREILPEEALPCYNSTVIEYFLYRIPGLSEHFLYGNDDMFFNADLSPSFFFAEDGFPYVRLQRKFFGEWRYRWKEWWGKELSVYRTTILKSARMVAARYGIFYFGTPHHNVDAYRKTDYEAVVETVFKQEITDCILHHKRSPDDIQRAVFLYYALAVGHAHLKYGGRKESCIIDGKKPDYAKQLRRYHPKLFCLNDNQYVTEMDRERIQPFLENLFSMKSLFEKEGIWS